MIRLRYLHVGLAGISPYAVDSGCWVSMRMRARVKWVSWNLLGEKTEAWVLAYCSAVWSAC